MPTMGETYLEVLDCLGAALGAALADLLGGVMDFSTVDAFGMVFGDWFDFGARELEWRMGSMGAERTD